MERREIFGLKMDFDMGRADWSSNFAIAKKRGPACAGLRNPSETLGQDFVVLEGGGMD